MSLFSYQRLIPSLFRDRKFRDYRGPGKLCRLARLGAAALALALGTSSLTGTQLRNFFAKSGGQIDLMVLLLDEDLADLFGHGVFSKRFTLRDTITVIANGFVFIIEIVAEHVSRIFGRAHRFGCNRRHFAEIIDLP